MTAPISNDLRLRVVQAIEGGLSCRKAAAKFAVSVASAVRWHQRYRETGDVAPRAMGGDRHSHRTESHAATIFALIDAQADISIRDIQAHLAAKGHKLSYGAIWRLLDRHDYTVKKRQPMPASKTGPT